MCVRDVLHKEKKSVEFVVNFTYYLLLNSAMF